MKNLILLFTLFLHQFTFAQTLKSGLLQPDSTFDVCCIHIPRSGLNIYALPKGEAIGKLILNSSDNNAEIYSASIVIGDKKTEFNFSNLEAVGYEIMSLVYTNVENDFVQIRNGYWLSVIEVQAKGLLLTTWMDYLIQKEDVLGWYPNDPGLNLRTEASTDAEIIVTMKGDLWEITPSQETFGLWCKVTVKQYTAHPCSSDESHIKQTYTGWVKLLSDDLSPNVWNYSKGC